MAFGTAKPVETDQTASTGERWELRKLTIVEGDEKTSRNGKVYWRVKDSDNKWYSVWEGSVKANLEDAASTGTAIDCAVQIKSGKEGGSPFYTIAGVHGVAEGLVKQGNEKAARENEPGGKNSAFNRRMHPDDALRVSMLNITMHSERMAEFTYGDAPESTTREQWLKAKIPEYNTFLSTLLLQPRTPTPPAKSDVPSDPEEKIDPGEDADIPF